MTRFYDAYMRHRVSMYGNNLWLIKYNYYVKIYIHHSHIIGN